MKYHFKYWLEPKGEETEVKLTLCGLDQLRAIIPGIGEAFVKFFPGETLSMEMSFKTEKNISIGFYFLGLELLNSSSLRLLPGVYSGFSSNGKTFKFDSVYNYSKGLYQMALAVDQCKTALGTTLQEYQWLTMSFPPAYKDGVAELKAGQFVSGKLNITNEKEDIWDPVHKKRDLDKSSVPSELLPKFSWKQYLKNWERYIDDKDLWVELGENMGMYHVGFYNVLKEPKLGGPFGYTCNGRKIRYKEVYNVFHKQCHEENLELGYFQDNVKHLEIAWGNGCNSMVAYALYNYGKKALKEKADAVVNAILNFKNGGFQKRNGALKGAWIGAFDASNGCFQDHYGGQQVFLSDQGIVNYFLGRIYLEGFYRDKKIIEKIRRNCEEFLLPVEKRFETFPNAFSEDGSEGYSREGSLYDKPNAPGVAQAALSFVILYELTQDSQYLAQAERIIETHMKPLIDANKFGFLEYDHLGWCSAGACSILIALAEYMEQQCGNIREIVKEMQKKVFYHLLSFRHEHDYFVYEHAKNVDDLGAKAITENGFLHGFTPGSNQGEYMLHIRYEYGYALLRTFQTMQCELSRSALINHLNYLTWQQFTNSNLKKGFGGITEHTGLRTYIQDTTHLIHSTPLPMILATKGLGD